MPQLGLARARTLSHPKNVLSARVRRKPHFHARRTEALREVASEGHDSSHWCLLLKSPTRRRTRLRRSYADALTLPRRATIHVPRLRESLSRSRRLSATERLLPEAAARERHPQQGWRVEPISRACVARGKESMSARERGDSMCSARSSGGRGRRITWRRAPEGRSRARRAGAGA